MKLFADDKSLFSIVRNQSSFINKLKADLEKINNWVHWRKMRFNPDPSKQGQDVAFNCKVINAVHSKLTFDSNNASHILSQKHLGLILDERLTLEGRAFLNDLE